MKKILMIIAMTVVTLTGAYAQKQAEIKFDKLVHDFGTFPEAEPIQKCTFTFTNVGGQPLVINAAALSLSTPRHLSSPVKKER